MSDDWSAGMASGRDGVKFDEEKRVPEEWVIG